VIFEASPRAGSHDACVALLRGYGYEVYSTMPADAQLMTPAFEGQRKMTPAFHESASHLGVTVDVIMIHLATFRQPAWRSILEAQRIAAIDGKPSAN
jgi:hypothetical protein